MKEKIKQILKHKYFKYLILLLIGLFLINESYNIYVDMYNFKQLEKAKPILEKINKSEPIFKSISEFNYLYNMNIKTIKNCYYISNNNGIYPYIFRFKLESITYKLKYLSNNYFYPEFGLEFLCLGGCPDELRNIYKNKVINTITNPCRD